ncbi:MAG: hypothetical protein ACJ8F7_02205 [Gemmataceae bacterium]
MTEFLELLFDEGRVTFTQRPASSPDKREAAVAVLRRTHEVACLDVAGSPLPFDADAAFAAAAFVRFACWFLVNREEPADALERLLVTAPVPETAAHHWAADLTFRFLPQLHRRARALSPDDPLTRRIEEALRRFPLSGVLSDVVAGPTTPTEFAGHPGLQLLYAERFGRNGRPEWKPTGRPAECFEWMQAERGG